MKFATASLYAILLVVLSTPLGAQENTCDRENPTNACTGKIVENRPALYSVKRALHPLSWLEAGLHPVIHPFATGKLTGLKPSAGEPGKSSLKFDVDRAGPNSGIGPKLILSREFDEPYVNLEGQALYTYRRYSIYQFKTTLPLTWTAPSGPVGRLSLQGLAAYQSRAADSFFGLGNDSSVDSQLRYRSITREAGVGLSAGLMSNTAATIQYLERNIGVALNKDEITAAHAAREPQVASLLTGARLHSVIFGLDRDTKDNPELPSRGSVQRIEIGFNTGAGAGQDFGYWKYRLDLQQYFPLNEAGRSVIALRGGAETNQERRGRTVPFVDLPIAGSWETLRGYADQRFYDQSALYAAAEYRYRIWQRFDWGFFVDAAQVGREPGDFGFDRFHTGYGFRLITRPTKNRAVTLDAAHSKEGWRLYVMVHPSF